MKKLKESQLTARLRYATKLGAETKRPARWSSTCEMLSRFLKADRFHNDGEFEETEDF